MIPPQKPWESATVNQRVPSNIANSDVLQSTLQNVGNILGAEGLNVRSVRNPPPLPPRPLRQAYQSGYGLGYGGSGFQSSPFPSYGGYGNNFNSYSGYGLGSFGGYGNYSNSFGGYGPGARYGFGHSIPESRFIQMAEDGSRPAFQSIESLVHAFGSVSFMLESTFNAMYSSFRAVLGVAENFGRLRALFGQFISVFAVFRWLRWLYRKCLFLMGISCNDPGQEQLWRKASEAVSGGNSETEKGRSSWPIMVFLGIILSGPYLMWKLLSSIDVPNIDPYNVKDWVHSKEPVLTAVALYDYNATIPQELSFRTGQKVLIAPKDNQQSPNWLLASVNGKKVGLIPANYIRILGRTKIQNQETTESHSEVNTKNEVLKIDEPNLITPDEQTAPMTSIPGPTGDISLEDSTSQEPSSNAEEL